MPTKSFETQDEAIQFVDELTLEGDYETSIDHDGSMWVVTYEEIEE